MSDRVFRRHRKPRRRLTPDLHPFLGGTYFPPDDKVGRRGFKSVLNTVAGVWRDKEADIRDSAADTVRQLQQMTKSDPAAAAAAAGAALGAAPLMKCAEMLEKRYDEKHGGFGCAIVAHDGRCRRWASLRRHTRTCSKKLHPGC